MGKILGIFGAGGLGREVAELAGIMNEKIKRWDDIIFMIDGCSAKPINQTKVWNYDEAIKQFGNNLEVSVALGEPLNRQKLLDRLEQDGIELATVIHPEVHIPATTIVGKGVTIQYGCFISCNVEISDGVYIQPQANIGHDDKLARGCVISGFANLAGDVTVGEFSYVGISTCVMEKTKIGKWSIVGMGSVVARDIPDEVIALGNPARPMKKNEEHKVFG